MGGVNRAPDMDALRAMSADRVLAAMETGPMISMATGRSAAERRAIAEAVTGKKLRNTLDITPLPKAMCARRRPATRVQSSRTARHGTAGAARARRTRASRTRERGGLTAADVPKLKLKWAFGFPGDLQSNAQATIVGGRVFVGSPGGGVYSLSAATGCIHWFYQAVGRRPLGDHASRASAHATSRSSATRPATSTRSTPRPARCVWKTRVDDFPITRISGSPTFYNGRLYVPGRVRRRSAPARSPTYECCHFRGSVVALDAATGKQLWKTYTIAEEPKPTTKNKIGTQLWGPSGAPVWSSPAIDTRRNALYVTTGNNYSDPATDTSDAFVALDLDTGKMLWHRQMTKNDAYVSACRLPDKTNCPSVNGPDFDFAVIADSRQPAERHAARSSPARSPASSTRSIPTTTARFSGRPASASAARWAASSGDRRPTRRTSTSPTRTSAASCSRIPTSRTPTRKRGGGMYALKLETGEKVWFAPPSDCGTRVRCSPAQSAAVSAFPGIAFSGSVDGHMRAYSTADGKVVWDYDTERPYETVNGVEARGGSIDGPGPAIGGGMVFFNSGYHTAGGQPGNVLLAFSVDGK